MQFVRDGTSATEEELSYRGSLLPVGSLAGNPFGLFDMAGNQCEWCSDDYGNYGTERHGDGLRPGRGSSHRVIRGGYFDAAANYAESGRRSISSVIRTTGIGVRPARTSRL